MKTIFKFADMENYEKPKIPLITIYFNALSSQFSISILVTLVTAPFVHLNVR